MNRVTEAYLAACAVPGNPLRTASSRLRFEHYFGRTWGARQLSRPVFIPEHHIQQAVADVQALYELMFALPHRLFAGDFEQLCAELGMEGRVAALASAAADRGRTPLYARPDLYYDGESFTLLELNAGAELGGVDTAAINHAYLELPEFQAFAAEHELEFVDTGAGIARYLREFAAPLTGGGAEPAVALVDIAENLEAWHDQYLAFAAHLAERGIDLKITHIADLGSRDGKLTLDGTPLDVTMRYFTLEEICVEPRAEEWLKPVLTAHAEGTTAFFASLDYAIYANKGMLALVSEMRERGQLSAGEAETVDRILPWTRRVSPQAWEHCRANRERLVLKPAAGGGGAGVTAGWEATDAEWAVAFKNALRTPYIVQQRADAMLETVPDPTAPDGTADWLPVYGLFIFDRQDYAGTFVRLLPANTGNVVNTNTGAAFTSVFTYPEERVRT